MDWLIYKIKEVAPSVVLAILLFVGGLFLLKFLTKLLRKGLQRSKLDQTVGIFVTKGLYYLGLTFLILACLSIFGIETTSIAAIIGAAGLAIGLAFQGTLSNLAAGIMLAIFRPFKVGDFLLVDGQSGTVSEIDFFQTMLLTPDNRVIIIPNSKIFGSTMEVVTAKETRRVDITVRTSQETDIEEARRVLEEAIKVEGAIEEPASVVVLTDISGSTVDWALRVWCKTADYWTVRERLVISAKKALTAANLAVPHTHVIVSNK